MTKKDAAEFFAQLAVFSARVLGSLGLPREGSPYGGTKGFDTPPTGVVLHYTADPSMERVARWFCDPRNLSSAHIIVSEKKDPAYAAFARDLPFIAALETDVLQLRPPTLRANHATWANAWSFGIEICNAGEVRTNSEGELVTWIKDWTTPYRHTPPWHINGRYFSPYPAQQMYACATIVGVYIALMQGQGPGILPPKIIGHENVQGTQTIGCGGNDKRDPSCACPTSLIRSYALNPTQTGYDNIGRFCLGVGSAESTRANLYSMCLGRRSCVEYEYLIGLAKNPKDLHRIPHVSKLMLALMGYQFDVTTRTFDAHEKISLELFQTMMGLKSDGSLGPVTAAAIAARHIDRGAPQSSRAMA